MKRKPEPVVKVSPPEPVVKVSPPEPVVDRATRSTLASFAAIVDRVERVVDTETEALSRGQPIDLTAFNRQKRQGLLELSRIMRSIATSGAEAEARRRLDRLAGKLETNRIVLDRQLRAVREVADIIAYSIKEAESDGTYSRPVHRR